jgi:hypothetical protein
LRAARASRAGRSDRITIITNNWLFDLNAPETGDIRFDRRFDLTGGEDTDFYRRAKQRGATSGWAPAAIAYETIPAERLTISYQFRRAANQNAVRLREKTARRGLPTRALIIAMRCSIDTLAALLHAVFLLPTLGRTFYGVVRYFGAAVGDLASLGKPRGGFYSQVTEG